MNNNETKYISIREVKFKERYIDNVEDTNRP
jgi:hypothetical protein